MTAPAMEAWSLDGVEDDLRADLEAAGVPLAAPADLDQGKRDALAGMLLRAMAQMDAEAHQLTVALQTEIAALQARVARRLDAIGARRATTEAQVRYLARYSDFGKKKSRDVGFGVYGSKVKAARLEIADPAAAVAEMERHTPELVRVTLKVTGAVAWALADQKWITPEQLAGAKRDVLVGDVEAYQKATGALPAGVVEREAEVTYFAKPEPLA